MRFNLYLLWDDPSYMYSCNDVLLEFGLDLWLVVLRIYVALTMFQPYRDLKAEDNQSLKS